MRRLKRLCKPCAEEEGNVYQNRGRGNVSGMVTAGYSSTCPGPVFQGSMSHQHDHTPRCCQQQLRTKLCSSDLYGRQWIPDDASCERSYQMPADLGWRRL